MSLPHWLASMAQDRIAEAVPVTELTRHEKVLRQSKEISMIVALP
jgi:hypothetical protein